MMKKILFALIMMAVILTGCIDDVPTEGHSYRYEFKVYSGGVMIYHDYVYDYDAVETKKWSLYKTLDDKRHNMFTMVVGDAVYKKVSVEDIKPINEEAPMNYPLSYTNTPVPEPVKPRTDTQGVTY